MINPNFIPSLNNLVDFSYESTISPRQGVFMRVPSINEHQLQDLSTKLDDILDQIAWHVATLDYELTAEPVISFTKSALAPGDYDEMLEKILGICIQDVPEAYLRKASLSVHLKVITDTGGEPVFQVETIIDDLDSRWDKQDAEKRANCAGQHFLAYWLKRSAWLLDSGVSDFKLRYDLIDVAKRYPHAERALVCLSREANRAHRLQKEGQHLQQ